MQKKKIALVSYYKDPNYGTMLQAYALYKAIALLGKDSEYISYISYLPRKGIMCKIIHIIKQIVKFFLKTRIKGEFSFFQTKDFKSTMDAFNNFHIKYIPESNQQYNALTINESVHRYEHFIVGSDQTWSPYMNRSPYSINFLSFISESSKKSAYAPSIGTTDIPEDFQQRLKKELSSFGNLSCRERSNCCLLEKLTSIKTEYVLDPTLLLDPSEWNKVAQAVNEMPQHYILCYILGEKNCIAKFAETLGEQHNIPVYYIVTRPKYLLKNNRLLGIGPAEFISLINNADYVITDSFHGTIFCVNYNVNFYSFSKRDIVGDNVNNDNARILTVLIELGLANRFRKDNDDTFESDIDFAVVNSIITSRRKDSINYLKSII